MKIRLLFYGILIIATSCKIQQDNGSNSDKYDPDKRYVLQLNPVEGSGYSYDITNETEVNVEVDDKKLDNLTRTAVTINYQVTKDSSGKFIFTTQYDKIHQYSKKNDVENDIDADNATYSLDPVEKMMGILKGAKIIATINRVGEVQSITGYKELGEKVIAGMNAPDANTRNILQGQWDKRFGDGMIRRNMDQMFKMFPDSAIHLNDTWKIISKQDDELSMIVKSFYKLKAINSEIAIISSEGKIISDSSNTSKNLMDFGATARDLKGEQQSEFEMEAKTGMLISCKINSTIEGTLEIAGREIPITIKSSVKMNGRKLK